MPLPLEALHRADWNEDFVELKLKHRRINAWLLISLAYRKSSNKQYNSNRYGNIMFPDIECTPLDTKYI